MTEADRFLSWLLDFGEAGTLSIVTGTACPCMVSRDANISEYSPEWHRNNPTAEACGGKGLITITTTTTNLKAIVCSPSAAGGSKYSVKEYLSTIGELQKDDMLFWGSINTATNAFLDLSGKNEARDYVTFQSVNYKIRDVSDYYWMGVKIGQIGTLVRKSS